MSVAELPAVLHGDNEYLRRAMEEGKLELAWGYPERYWPQGLDGWADLPEPERTVRMNTETRHIARRHELVRQFSWAIPNDAALDALTELSPIVEVGAGGGYWTKLLRERGATVYAFDPHEPGPENEFAKRRWTEVEQTATTVPAAVYVSDVTLFLCWPSMNELWPEQTLAAYCGPAVAYIGEGEGGCCATPGFFALLERDFEQVREVDIPRWYGIRDSLTIWRRREATDQPATVDS